MKSKRVELDGTVTTLLDGKVVREQWSDARVQAFNKQAHPDNRMRKKIVAHYVQKYGAARPYRPAYPAPQEWCWVEINGKILGLETEMHGLVLGMAFEDWATAAIYAARVGGIPQRTGYDMGWAFRINGRDVPPEKTNAKKLLEGN